MPLRSEVITSVRHIQANARAGPVWRVSYGTVTSPPSCPEPFRRGQGAEVVARRSAGVRYVGLIRFTVADQTGTVSFVGPGHVMKMLVASCAKGPSTLVNLLDLTRRYDDQFADTVLNGITVFDEHNLPDNTSSIEQVFENVPPENWPPFRVYNDVTRRASTEPARAGLIVINLNAKRIIQVQNSYAEIQRRDRGRIRNAGKPTRQLYHYDLPTDWALVP